jgi:hypothetical protein
MSEHVVPLNVLSDWMLPLPSVRDSRPVRVFDTAGEAMAF